MTETLPPLDPAVATILFVVELPVQPFGSDQVYEVAPLTAATENVSNAPLHTDAFPLIVPGVAGAAVIETAKV